MTLVSSWSLPMPRSPQGSELSLRPSEGQTARDLSVRLSGATPCDAENAFEVIGEEDVRGLQTTTTTLCSCHGVRDFLCIRCDVNLFKAAYYLDIKQGQIIFAYDAYISLSLSLYIYIYYIII